MRLPAGSPLTAVDLRVESFSLDPQRDPGRVVRGRVVRARPCAGALPQVLVVHGFKGFMDWGFFPFLAAALARAGMAVVQFNFSGSGLGEDPERMDQELAFERNTHSRELEDLASVRALLDEGRFDGLDPERAGLVGHSRGGALALLHAAESARYRAVVTWAALDELDRYDPQTKALWRANGFLEAPNARTGQVHRLGLGLLEDLETNRARLDVLAACRRLQARCLLVHGVEDEVVAPEAQSRLAGALGSRARSLSLPAAGHTFGIRHPWEGRTRAFDEALAATAAHLATYLASAPDETHPRSE